jgi:23S rRNA pseudouridine1911/1915/1917 synthase
MFTLIVPNSINMRLDKYLSENLDQLSRSKIKSLINDGKVMINGEQEKSSYRLNGNESIVVYLDEDETSTNNHVAQEIPLTIIHEDDDILIIDKQAGLVVHPGTGMNDNTLLNGLLYYTSSLSDINGPSRLGIVHRLDKDTSGIMVVAKTNSAHKYIAEQFEKRNIIKTYISLTWGIWEITEGSIDNPIKRKRSDPTVFTVDKTGRNAFTSYKVENSWRYISKVQFKPKTGRTHQIRVHSSFMGHPIISDNKYGGGENRVKGFLPEVSKELKTILQIFNRQALHAYSIEFIHPKTKDNVKYISPLPNDFKDAIAMLNEKYG